MPKKGEIRLVNHMVLCLALSTVTCFWQNYHIDRVVFFGSHIVLKIIWDYIIHAIKTSEFYKSFELTQARCAAHAL